MHIQHSSDHITLVATVATVIVIVVVIAVATVAHIISATSCFGHKGIPHLSPFSLSNDSPDVIAYAIQYKLCHSNLVDPAKFLLHHQPSSTVLCIKFVVWGTAEVNRRETITCFFTLSLSIFEGVNRGSLASHLFSTIPTFHL